MDRVKEKEKGKDKENEIAIESSDKSTPKQTLADFPGINGEESWADIMEKECLKSAEKESRRQNPWRKEEVASSSSSRVQQAYEKNFPSLSQQENQESKKNNRYSDKKKQPPQEVETVSPGIFFSYNTAGNYQSTQYSQRPKGSANNSEASKWERGQNLSPDTFSGSHWNGARKGAKRQPLDRSRFNQPHWNSNKPKLPKPT